MQVVRKLSAAPEQCSSELALAGMEQANNIGAAGSSAAAAQANKLAVVDIVDLVAMLLQNTQTDLGCRFRYSQVSLRRSPRRHRRIPLSKRLDVCGCV